MLYSKHEKLSIEDVMSFDNKNELISWIAEKKVIDLTYKSFEDLNNYLIQEYKFCLITDLNQINKIAKLIYYRNLLVHNRGIINHKFLKLFPEKKLGEKLELDSSFVFGSSNFLLEISAEIDEVAIKKYSLTRVKRDDSDCPTK
jgi:hypothetical protein